MLLTAMRTISIASFALVTALVAACVAVVSVRFELGVGLSVVSFLALMRTTLFAAYRKAHQIPLSLLEKVGAFALSLVFVCTIAASSAVAFFGICLPVAVASRNGMYGMWAGSLAAGALFLFLLRLPVYRNPPAKS